MTADGSGGWFIGGEFSAVGDVARSNLAHIRADGTLDPAFAPQADQPVRALVLNGTTLYVGGSFTQIKGLPRNRLAAVNATTAAVLPWDPNVTGHIFPSVGDRMVFAGGSFYYTGLQWTGIVVGVVMGVLFSAAMVLAGSLEPSGGPTAAGSQMYTLDQIYDLINNGTIVEKKATFTEPGSGPTAPTMHTLDDIYNLVGLRAPVPKTGQTPAVPLNPAPSGSDGALQKGISWPNPRFTDNGNGTVTDNLTGLIWLRDTNCVSFFSGDATGVNSRPWANALTAANSLAGGQCGLTDGSVSGQWRLPNVKELQSLIDYVYVAPALSNTAGNGHWGVDGGPFLGVQSAAYWSSSTYMGSLAYAWYVTLDNGRVVEDTKTTPYYVWPVRGGQ